MNNKSGVVASLLGALLENFESLRYYVELIYLIVFGKADIKSADIEQRLEELRTTLDVFEKSLFVILDYLKARGNFDKNDPDIRNLELLYGAIRDLRDYQNIKPIGIVWLKRRFGMTSRENSIFYKSILNMIAKLQKPIIA